jgi:hypothetical protein
VANVEVNVLQAVEEGGELLRAADGLADRACTHGGGTVEGPYDTAWNTRDLRAVDPAGYRLLFSPASRRPRRTVQRGVIDLASEQGLGG